ncbi:MAG: solute carrier family 23 protein [Planctomycetota bacterium]
MTTPSPDGRMPMASTPDDAKILYGLDDKPAFGRAAGLGFQHVLTMFGSTVAVPLLFAPALWPIPDALPKELAERLETIQLTNAALLISSVMLCSGVATLLQVTLGSRLPIIQGVSFSFLAAFFGIVAATLGQAPIDWAAAVATPEALETAVTQWQDSGARALRVIAGAIIFGGIVEAIVGFTGLMGQVRRILSPVVIGPVIMLIGLALYQFGAPFAASNWPISILTMAMIVVFALVLSRRVRLFKLFPMLLAILGAVAVCAALGGAGLVTDDNPAFVDLSAVGRADTLRLTTLLFPWGLPEFTGAAIVAVLAGYLASMIESFGDYHACKQIAGAGDPTPAEISRGIGFEGVACAITGVLGGFSSTSYSENIGLVGLTRVASRYVVLIGAVMLILLGLFGKFGALAAAIPQPVVGGLYCTMFGLIAAVGVRQFARADLTSDRNLFIGGFALFMGLSVPFYFQNGGSDAVSAALPASLAGIAIAIGTTGMAVAAILGLTLDNLVPGTPEERGLVHTPSILIQEADDVDTVLEGQTP